MRSAKSRMSKLLVKHAMVIAVSMGAMVMMNGN